MNAAISTTVEFLVGVYSTPDQAPRKPQILVELCAPLHCMLAEAVAVAPGSMVIPHMSLVFMRTLQEIYVEVSAFQG